MKCLHNTAATQKLTMQTFKFKIVK